MLYKQFWAKVRSLSYGTRTWVKFTNAIYLHKAHIGPVKHSGHIQLVLVQSSLCTHVPEFSHGFRMAHRSIPTEEYKYQNDLYGYRHCSVNPVTIIAFNHVRTNVCLHLDLTSLRPGGFTLYLKALYMTIPGNENDPYFQGESRTFSAIFRNSRKICPKISPYFYDYEDTFSFHPLTPRNWGHFYWKKFPYFYHFKDAFEIYLLFQGGNENKY